MAKKKKKEYNQGIVTLDNSGNVTTVKKSQDYKTNYAPKKEVNKPSVGKVLVDSTINSGKTLGNVATNMGKGALKTLEAINDTANNLATKANTGMESLLLGLAGKNKKEIKKLTDAEKKANREYIKSDRTNALLDATGWNEYQKKFEEGSLVKESNLGGQIAQGVGGMVPSLLAGQYFGGVSAPGQSLKGLKGVELAKTAAKNVGTNLMNNAAANSVLAASSYGSGVEEAYQQGATDKQANLYGLGNAALEFGTEMLTGGIPGLENQTGIVDNLVEKGINKATSGITKQIPKAIAKSGLKIGSNMLGEGFEEGLSTLLNPALKNATYADGEKVNWEEVGRSALVGGLTGAFLSGPQDLMTMSNEVRQARQQQLQEVQSQVQSGEITPEQGTQKLEQIEKGTYKENQQLNQIAQQKVEEIQQAVQNGNISNQEAIKEIEAVSQTLSQQREQLNNNLNTQEQQEYNDLQNLPFELDGQELKRLNQLEAKKNNTELYQAINNRENVDLSDRNIKAIQQEHPEVKPFYQDVATDLLNEIEDMGTKASTIYKENEFGENTVERTKRYIPDSDLREYADSNNITMEKLKDGLSRIIEDNGKENTKVAKEVEQILDKKLQDGYTTVREGKIPPNQDYIDLVSGKVKPNELLNANIETNDDVIVAPNTKEVAKEITQKINNISSGDAEMAKIAKETGKEARSLVATVSDALGTADQIQNMDREKITYNPISNKETMTQAQKELNNLSYDEKIGAVKEFIYSDRRVTAKEVAKIEAVIEEARNAGDMKTYQSLVEDAAILATETGQVTQAWSIIQKATPEGKLSLLEKIIAREQARGNKTYNKVKLKENLVEDILNSYNEDGSVNQEKLDKAMDAMTDDIAKQMPGTLSEKVNSWRYLSMLGNPKTHIRNISANVAMKLVKDYKDIIRTAGESLFVKKENRTTTFKKASNEIKDFTNNLANSLFGENQMESKYSTGTSREQTKNVKKAIEGKRDIFGKGIIGKTIGKVADLNTKALDIEDRIFSKIEFKKSMNNYLTAQGIKTQKDLDSNPDIIKKAQEYAIKQAKEATFRQDSKLADIISEAERKLDKGSILDKAGSAAIKATLPFKKTPINIAKTGIDYTPGLGLLTTISNVKNAPKNLRGSELANGLAKQLTGGSLAALGYYLASNGILFGSSGDDEKEKLEKDLGKQDFSVKIGNRSYDISFLSPSAMPLLIGGEIYKISQEQDEELNPTIVMDILSKTLDPLTETSVISSLTDLMRSYQYSASDTDLLSEKAQSVVNSYVSQFFPTFLSQIASVFDDKKRSTRVESDSDNKWGETLKRQIMYKIPGARNMLPEQVDRWGNAKTNVSDNVVERAFNAFFMPSNNSQINIDETTQELEELYDLTGNKSVLPKTIDNSIQLDDKSKKVLTTKEKNQIQKDYGSLVLENYNKLKNNKDYQNMSDEDKAEVIANIYSYSKSKAIADNIEGKSLSSTYKTAQKAVDSGYSIADYYATKKYNSNQEANTTSTTKKEERNRYQEIAQYGISGSDFDKFKSFVSNVKSDKDANGNTISGSKKNKIIAYINGMPLSAVQKQKLYEDYKNNSGVFTYYK